MVLADGAVFKLRYFSSKELLPLSVNLTLLVVRIITITLIFRVLLQFELDEREVSLETFHEFTELNIL